MPSPRYRKQAMISIHLRVPGEVLAFCRLEAIKLSIPTQEYIRGVLEERMQGQERLTVLQQLYQQPKRRTRGKRQETPGKVS